MPSTAGDGYASTAFVWRDWQNQTGYTSGGFVFLAGMLNGAYARLCFPFGWRNPTPTKKHPQSYWCTNGSWSCNSTFLPHHTLILRDLDSVLGNPYTFPLAEVYLQATNSGGSSLGILIIIFCPTICTCIGTYTRANVVDPRPRQRDAGLRCRLHCACVHLRRFFNGLQRLHRFLRRSSTLSYLAAILPHMLS